MDKLLVICGPTATGKTKLTTALARQLDGELVSADSRQIFKLMNIGTGKDLPKTPTIIDKAVILYNNQSHELVAYDIGDGVPIWMYDVVYPNEEFSVSHYWHIASSVIENILKRNKLPILVGGTGFYIDSIVRPPETIDVPMNPSLRKKYTNATIETLQNALHNLDKETFSTLNDSDRQNPRRLIRKIEIAKASGLIHLSEASHDFDTHRIGLTMPNANLFDRIDERVDKRMEQGMLKEIQTLLALGYSWDLPSMSGLGYWQWKIYFEGNEANRESLKQSCIEKWKQDEHRYAKRQMTWFKKNKNIQWFDLANPSFEKTVTKSVVSWYT